MQRSAVRSWIGVVVGAAVGLLIGWVSAGGGAAVVVAAAAAWPGWLAARAGDTGTMAAGPMSWAAALRAHWMAVTAVAGVGACLVRIRADGGDPSSLYLVVMIAGPAAALLLARSAAGVRGRIGRTLAAFALGATVVLVVTVVLYGLTGSIGVGIAAPPIGAVARTLESLAGGILGLEALTTRRAAALLAFTVVVTPLVEEITKPVGGIAACPRTRAEAFVLSAASGAGFSLAENYLVAGTTVPYAWLPVLATRAVSAAIPVLGAGIMGLALYDRQQPGTGMSLPRALGLAGLLHAVWNGVLTVGSLAAAPRTAFSVERSLDPGWSAVASLLLAATATLAIWGLLRVGRGARSPVPAPMLGLPRQVRLRWPAAAGWAVLALLVLIPITWGHPPGYPVA